MVIKIAIIGDGKTSFIRHFKHLYETYHDTTEGSMKITSFSHVIKNDWQIYDIYEGNDNVL